MKAIDTNYDMKNLMRFDILLRGIDVFQPQSGANVTQGSRGMHLFPNQTALLLQTCST